MDERKNESIRRLKEIWLEQMWEKFTKELEHDWKTYETIGQGLGIDRDREKEILKLACDAILANEKKHEVIIFLQRQRLPENELLLAVFYASTLIIDCMSFLQKLMLSQEMTEFLEKATVEKISEEIFSSAEKPEGFFFGS